MSDPEKLLAVQDLRVYFEKEDTVAKAVDGVDFEIYPGETVCLVGESGCGKTVTALSLLGLIPQPMGRIRQGSIHFQDMEITSMDRKRLEKIRGKNMGMVFQDPLNSLNPLFSIGEQIQEILRIHENLDSRETEKRCIKALQDVGISSPRERLGSFPHELSGGQLQRVMIAMALVCNPELLIADEPTTALDVTIQAQILNLLKSVQKQGSRSVLYITHDLGVVANVAKRVYVMYAGVIVEQGSVGNIFENPRHPYTQGLLASIPTLAKKGSKLFSIEGNVPDPGHKPSGCPFHPRCYAARESCRNEFPGMVDCGDGQKSRCPVLN